MALSTIYFYNADHPFVLRHKNTIRQWINSVVKQHDKTIEQVAIIFCSDDYLLQINRQFLNHDYFTDIITFDSSNQNELALEAYISVDRVKDNAKQLSITTTAEMHRVLIHGILHCLGYKDKTTQEIEKMRGQEEKSLELLRKLLKDSSPA